jgi:peptidoglycan/xylan/chitin deacetylase (PgdA/CDA1 family)
MKVIISHDVDHLTAREHLKDMIIPKYVIRAKLELFFGKISLKEFFCRMNEIFDNKWQNIEEVMRFDKKHNVPSTFFFGMDNGLGLSYNILQAEPWIKRVLENGFEAGVHGIAFNDIDRMKTEFDKFRAISNRNDFGIRMHYLRNDETTLNLIGKTGYEFDSTIYKLEDPHKMGELWEFPLHIMEGYILEDGKSWQRLNLEQAKQKTLELIQVISDKNLKYLNILFHDRYFTDAYKTWKAWYIWIIEYLQEKGHEFVNFRQAILELK